VPSHKEIKLLPHSSSQLFDLVSDIEKYPEFLPWCLSVNRISSEKDSDSEIIIADMEIGFQFFREKIRTRVRLLRPDESGNGGSIKVEYIKGPLRYLNNHWQFRPIEVKSCELDFFVEFEFKSILFQQLIGALFHQAVKKMVFAFEVRAKELYGDND
tara:strand:- start:230 stop:700 length:471 start_codon:yes stop_codon:yes gene_type:complete